MVITMDIMGTFKLYPNKYIYNIIREHSLVSSLRCLSLDLSREPLYRPRPAPENQGCINPPWPMIHSHEKPFIWAN